jgi:hypothetical protein
VSSFAEINLSNFNESINVPYDFFQRLDQTSTCPEHAAFHRVVFAQSDSILNLKSFPAVYCVAGCLPEGYFCNHPFFKGINAELKRPSYQLFC